MHTVLLILGWCCFAVAATFAARMHSADRRLQAHRAPGTPGKRYDLIPVRWQHDLYVAEGAPIVDEAWRHCRRMIGFALLGIFLLALATT